MIKLMWGGVEYSAKTREAIFREVESIASQMCADYLEDQEASAITSSAGGTLKLDVVVTVKRTTRKQK